MRRRAFMAAAAAAGLAACRKETPVPDRSAAPAVSLANLREFRSGHAMIMTAPLGAIQANCYVVADAARSAAAVIDPGGEPEAIAAYVRQAGWKVEAIIATHGHVDHVAAVQPLRRLVPAPFYMHAADRALLAQVKVAGSRFGYPGIEEPEFDQDLGAVRSIALGDLRLSVLHTPGHSPGSCCLLLQQAGAVFTGDTLFRRNVGRTDLQGGSRATLSDSIKGSLYGLNDELTVYCGHGEATTIGEEKRLNPFVRAG